MGLSIVQRSHSLTVILGFCSRIMRFTPLFFPTLKFRLYLVELPDTLVNRRIR